MAVIVRLIWRKGQPHAYDQLTVRQMSDAGIVDIDIVCLDDDEPTCIIKTEDDGNYIYSWEECMWEKEEED